VLLGPSPQPRAARRLGALDRCVNQLKWCAQIVWFCVRSAELLTVSELSVNTMPVLAQRLIVLLDR